MIVDRSTIMELFEYIDIFNQPFDIFTTAIAQSGLHWHYYSEILYVKKGKLRLICNDYSFMLEENDICYIYPLQLHEVQNAEDSESEYIVIKFDIHTIHLPKAYIQKMYDYFLTRTSENDYCIIVKNFSNAGNGYGECIDNTVLEYSKKQDFYMLQVQANIFTLLIAIARLGSKEMCETEKPSGSNMSFHHILEYIDTHSSEKIEIEELAEKCHMSYSHFAKLFRENYGRSCKEYITYIRLNKADELLMHTDYDIAYIAAETGFFDSSHFIHAYKKWKGLTPKQQKLQYINIEDNRRDI